MDRQQAPFRSVNPDLHCHIHDSVGRGGEQDEDEEDEGDEEEETEEVLLIQVECNGLFGQQLPARDKKPSSHFHAHPVVLSIHDACDGFGEQHVPERSNESPSHFHAHPTESIHDAYVGFSKQQPPSDRRTKPLSQRYLHDGDLVFLVVNQLAF